MTSHSYKIGDGNFDGSVNVTDILKLSKHISIGDVSTMTGMYKKSEIGEKLLNPLSEFMKPEFDSSEMQNAKDTLESVGITPVNVNLHENHYFKHIVPNDPEEFSDFAQSIDIDDDLLVVGRPNKSLNSVHLDLSLIHI